MATTTGALEGKGLNPRLMIDCSHANSGKDHRVQPEVTANVAGQVAAGNAKIFGVMLESFLEDGNQNHEKVEGELRYGQSITDACMSWERTLPLFDTLGQAVRERRS